MADESLRTAMSKMRAIHQSSRAHDSSAESDSDEHAMDLGEPATRREVRI